MTVITPAAVDSCAATSFVCMPPVPKRPDLAGFALLPSPPPAPPADE
jgi:hypothetical protein